MKLISSTYMRICQSTKGNVNAKERLSLLKVRLQTDQISKDPKQKRTTKIRDLKEDSKVSFICQGQMFCEVTGKLESKAVQTFQLLTFNRNNKTKHKLPKKSKSP